MFDIKNAYLKYENYKVISGVVSQERKQAISFTTLRNRNAAFQIIVTPDEDTMLELGDNVAAHWAGHIETLRLEASVSFGKVLLSPVGMVLAGQNDADDESCDGYYADPILKDDYILAKKGSEQAIYAEVKIPRDLIPGEYTGKIKLFRHLGFTAEKLAGELTFTVEVLGYTLADGKDLPWHLDLWQHSSNIARHHEVRRWSEEHFTILEKYVASLAELGQKAVTIIASEVPWSGQSCFDSPEYPSNLFEHSMISVVKKKAGSFVYDFSACDRYIEICSKYGIKDEIEVFGLINIWQKSETGYSSPYGGVDGQRIRYYDENAGLFDYMHSEEEVGSYIEAIAEHFNALGLHARVRIVADEPSDAELYIKRRDFVSSHAPGFKFKAAVFDYKFIEASGNKISDYVPIISGIASDPENMERVRKALDARFLWYICCGPAIPNTFITSKSVESYGIGWITSLLNFDGFLRWAYTEWPDDPRRDMRYKWRAGDTGFVYPSKGGDFLLSLRWKALRRGAEIFALTCDVKKYCPDADKILAEAYSIVFKTTSLRDFHEVKAFTDIMTDDYEAYERAEKLLANALTAPVK